LRGSALSLFDKLAIGRAMLAIARLPNPAPDDPQVSFLDWLHQHGQTRGAIERFWKVVLVSALNEDLDRISVRYAVQVFRESFLNSAVAGRMGVPTVPLTQLYSAAGDYIRERGGEVVLRSSVAAVTPQGEYVALGIDGNTNFARFDYVVLAVASTVIEKLLPDDDVAQGLREQVVHLDTSPITGIHLWFDRDITDLDHAVLLDRTIQWLFYKSRFQPQRAESQGSYLELVVSSSKSLVDKTRQQILDLALSELREFFPAANQAQLLKATVIKELHATFSVKPGVDRYRPATQTGWPRVFFAGDWTQTGWPATMEGAVRSGYLAAEALTRAAASGDPQTFVAPDLAAAGLMRFR
jgi:zeta-carotene desaturase